MTTPPSREPRGRIVSHDESPGSFVDGVWKGEMEWRTQHGTAYIQWFLGRPQFVWSALSLGGERVDVESRFPASLTFRHTTSAGRLEHGDLDVRADEVVFTPCVPQPAPLRVREGDELQPLIDMLAADAAFMHELEASPGFASALYAELEHASVTTADGERFEFGQRGAANFVADLRGDGVDYLDYAWGRGGSFSDAETAAVRAHLARLNILVA